MSLVAFGKVVGHKSRVAILEVLMGGESLSASELAYRAGITNQTASSHLNQLVKANLLHRRKCGRFHYYQIINETVASFIEQVVCGSPVKDGCCDRHAVKTELKKARFCYDHLAGELGVGISHSLVTMGALILDQASFHLPEREHHIYQQIGINLNSIRTKRRQLCLCCTDWTESFPHVAGALGAAIAGKLVEQKFIIRSRNDRSVAITRSGRSFFVDTLKLSPSLFHGSADARKFEYRGCNNTPSSQSKHQENHKP